MGAVGGSGDGRVVLAVNPLVYQSRRAYIVTLHILDPIPVQIKILVIRCVKTRRFQSLSTQKYIQLIGVALLAGMFW